MADIEGHEEVRSKFLAGLSYELRMGGIPYEERMRGIDPGKRLQGLSDEEAILALPTSVLRSFPPEYLATLPAEFRERIARKLAETTSL